MLLTYLLSFPSQMALSKLAHFAAWAEYHEREREGERGDGERGKGKRGVRRRGRVRESESKSWRVMMKIVGEHFE